MTDISQISEEDLNRFTLIVAEKIRNIMDSFQTSDSMVVADAVVIGQGTVPYADDSYDEYIMELADASDYLEEDLEQQKSQNERIMTNAMNHGHSGYVTAANHDKRAVWLFFYDNQEECNNILTHIKEDLR